MKVSASFYTSSEILFEVTEVIIFNWEKSKAEKALSYDNALFFKNESETSNFSSPLFLFFRQFLHMPCMTQGYIELPPIYSSEKIK